MNARDLRDINTAEGRDARKILEVMRDYARKCNKLLPDIETEVGKRLVEMMERDCKVYIRELSPMVVKEVANRA